MKIIETVTPASSTTHYALNDRVIYPTEAYYQDDTYEGLVDKLKKAARKAWSAYEPGPDSTELTLLFQWRLVPTKQTMYKETSTEVGSEEVWIAVVAISAVGVAEGDDFKYPTTGDYVSIIPGLD